MMTTTLLRQRAAASAMALMLLPLNGIAGDCGFKPAFEQPDEKGTTTLQVYQGDPVAKLGNARPLLYISGLKVNTDGTQISYHEQDPTGRRCVKDASQAPCALNNIRNAYRDPHRPESDFEAIRKAGYPPAETWRLLSPDIIEKDAKTGQPCRTRDGYLVSMTADVAVAGGFDRQGDCDQSKWIDALTVPAIVIPKQSRFLSLGVARRSMVVAISADAARRVVPGIVGDTGPADELGEASIAMNRSLNGLPETEVPKHRDDAVHRFQAGKTAVLIFTGSTAILARPITPQRVFDNGQEALIRFGGTEKLIACIRDEVDPGF